MPCANGCATGCNGLERLGMCNPTKTRATKKVDVRSKAKHYVPKKGDASTRRFSMQKDFEFQRILDPRSTDALRSLKQDPNLKSLKSNFNSHKTHTFGENEELSLPFS